MVLYRRGDGRDWLGLVVKVVSAERQIVNVQTFDPETGATEFQHNVLLATTPEQTHCWRPIDSPESDYG
jgi:hypothetical protein